MTKQIKKVEFCVEVAIFGFIVSLFLHHYFFQSFKVMTHSMEPTLIGDPQCGDRILVKKSAYYLKSPARWDTIVFQYPHDRSQVFIKRLVGLPGEKIHIQNGDIYINDKVERKPAHISKQLLHPLFTKKSYRDDIKEHWDKPDEWKWQNDSFAVQSEGKTWLRYKPVITNRYIPENNILFLYRTKYSYPVGGSEYVGEIMFSATVIPRSATGSVFIEIHEGVDRFIISFGIENNDSFFEYYSKEGKIADKRKSLAVQLHANQPTEIKIANIDDRVTVIVDYKEVLVFDYDKEASEAPKYTFSSSFSCGIENAHVMWSNIELWRDIYYISRRDFFGSLKTYYIPKNHYFVLGDNPPNSRDSKDWQRFYFFFENGIHVSGDQKNFPHGTTRKFTDINGIKREISMNSLRQNYISREDSPFVPSSLVIGQAFIVFWPPTRNKKIW